MLTLDPKLFGDEAITEETRAVNRNIIERIEASPDQWSISPADIRARRALGEGPFPLAEKSPRAETKTIAGPGGPIELRIIRPKGDVRGIYYHIHGGGWTFGGASEQDPRLEQIADRCGLAAVSVEYRLAPEHPYPAGPDDCEAAALWLHKNAKVEFGSDWLSIGGESAGAHLSVVTVLRLRDRHGLTPFRKANLVAGCFDMALTPSARNFGDENLVLRTRDIESFRRCFLGNDAELSNADISPIHADLTGLPHALFTIGTRDALLDDSLFLASRWLSAGNRVDLKVYPGGAHAFQGFPCALTEQSLADMDAFLGSDT